jgi:hypothetical protein
MIFHQHFLVLLPGFFPPSRGISNPHLSVLPLTGPLDPPSTWTENKVTLKHLPQPLRSHHIQRFGKIALCEGEGFPSDHHHIPNSVVTNLGIACMDVLSHL